MKYICGGNILDGTNVLVHSSPLKGRVEKIYGCSKFSCTAIVLAAQAVGISRIYNVPKCREVSNVISVLKALKVRIYHEEECVVVEGVGLGGFTQPDRELCVGNSVWVACSMLGVLSTYPFSSFVVKRGAISDLDSRHIRRVQEVLQLTGARFIHSNTASIFPMLVLGAEDCIPITMYEGQDAEVVSMAALLASMNIVGKNCIHCKHTLGMHIESLLCHFNTDVVIEEKCVGSEPNKENVSVITLEGQKEIFARDISVFPSMSNVLCVMFAALVIRDSSVTIPGVCIDKRMRCVVDIIVRMGGNIVVSSEGDDLHSISICWSRLEGIDVSYAELSLIDEELPLVSSICACAEGDSKIWGISYILKYHKSRMEAVFKGLRDCGIGVAIEGDAVIIHGKGSAGIEGGSIVDTLWDYRISMPLSVLGLISKKPIVLNKCCKEEMTRFLEVLGKLT